MLLSNPFLARASARLYSKSHGNMRFLTSSSLPTLEAANDKGSRNKPKESSSSSSIDGKKSQDSKVKSTAAGRRKEDPKEAQASSSTPGKNTNNNPVVRTAPRDLPTRHSRHNKPPVAPTDSLNVECQKIMDAPPGTLFVYNSKNLHQDKVTEYEQGLMECHVLQQKVEYLLRGYSSMIPGSLVHSQSSHYHQEQTTKPTSSYDEVILKMIQLVERLDLEGKAYVELRSKYRSQLAHVSSHSSQQHSSSQSSQTPFETNHQDDIQQPSQGHDNDNLQSNQNKEVEDDDDETEFIIDETTDNHAWRMNALILHYGAPPGPTNAMYDLILDAIAVSVGSSNNALAMLEHSRNLYNQSLQRYELDAKAGTDALNPESCPTAATFNAVIRGAAKAAVLRAHNDEQVRDYAMENAFFAFNAMYHHPIVHRNAATYRYMLEMMEAVFPVGAMRGNIAAAMWEQAVQDKVVDLSLFEVMKRFANASSHGEMFDVWWKKVEGKFVKDVNGHGFPLVWGRNKNIRRYDRKSDTY